jgi:catechol 1,2-dioxygenase
MKEQRLDFARHLGRRTFLGTVGGGLLVSACTGDADRNENQTGSSSAGPGSGGASSSNGTGTGTSSAGGNGQGGTGPLACTPSDPNILGPYYRPGAPFLDDLTTPEMPGVRVTVSGKVLDPSCNPIANALLDVWQADDSGGYDNDGVADPPPNVFVLRGKLYSDAEGNYSFKTIIPGQYLNGSQYRPAHIHVTVTADGHDALTTQLYFEGDPYNDIDPFIVDSLIMPLEDAPGGEKTATYDFVIAPTP